MRQTATRIIISAALVSGLSVFTHAESADPRLPAQAAAPAAADIAGTYVGTITSETPGELPDGGMIVIKSDGDTLVVSAGPDVDGQMVAEKVQRTGDQLKFQLTLPGEVTRLITFDLTAREARLTGSVTLTAEGQSRKGTLAFARQ